MSAAIFQIQSSLIVLLMIFGVLKRRERQTHVRTMWSVIIWDIALILQIELTRSAINKASKATSNPMILNIHVMLALTTVLLYFFMIYSGKKILNNNGDRSIHKKAGLTTFVLRIATYITSYWAV